MKKHYFALVVLFFYKTCLFSQTLQQPELNFSYACMSESFHHFQVRFSFSDAAFDSENIFYIEISDAEGDFSDPIQLASVSDKNSAYEFTLSLDFPLSLAGSGYLIRMRSTAPALTSTPSSAFEAYYVPDEPLILNNYEVSAFCAAETTLLELNSDVADQYTWYKDGQVYMETSVPYIEVNESGQFYAEPYFGGCSGALISNIVKVEALEPIAVSLDINEDILACTGQEIVLRAATEDPTYTYQWFRNENPVESEDANSPVLAFQASDDTYGYYYLEATNAGGCTARSETIIIYKPTGITVKELSPLKSVLIGDAIASLDLEANASGLDVTWYKDGNVVAQGTDLLSLEADSQGVYHAEINDQSGCGSVVTSNNFEVFEPMAFTVETGFRGVYEPCENTSATLELKLLTGWLSNGDRVNINKDLYQNFDFVWKDESGQNVTQGQSLVLNDHLSSGTYELAVSYKGMVYKGEPVDVYIGLPAVTLGLETALTCNQSAVLSVPLIEDAFYNWYKDDSLVTSGIEPEFTAAEEGLYRVEVEYMGCVAVSEQVAVVQEVPEGVQVYPGERVALIPDRTLELEATGADAYTWTNMSGEVLSESAVLPVTDEGTYYLEAVVGGCNITKTVEVYFNYVSAIPNVITPNNDSVNDHWVLPGKMLEDPDLEVLICDSYGQTVLKTRNYDNSWPQSVGQLPSQESNFYYVLSKGGKSLQKGVITLVR